MPPRHEDPRNRVSYLGALAENQHRRDRTEERRRRENRGLSCGAEESQRVHVENDADAVAEESDEQRVAQRRPGRPSLG
jgi:hypothetical protein